MPHIASFVFIDMETTGLGAVDKITELAMVAVSRKSLCNVELGFLPRVQHKLVICLKPERPIPAIVTRITGFTESLLESEQVFDKDAGNMIKLFLFRLKPPVCLVAHNGNAFDFPRLLKQLNCIQVKLPLDVVCADTLPMFRSILKNKVSLIPLPMPAKPDETDMLKELDFSLEVFAEFTNDFTPFPVNMEPFGSSSKKESVNLEPSLPASNLVKQPPKVPKSHKLVDIYEYIFDKLPDMAHRAEGDCLMMLECCAAMANQVVDWCDSNSVVFSTIETRKSMKVFVPRKTRVIPLFL